MFNSIWEQLSGQIADRWAVSNLLPALLFWLLGFGLWIGQIGWGPFENYVLGLSTFSRAALFILVLGFAVVSAAVAARLETWLLRLLEGEWPGWWGPLTRWRVERHRRSAAQRLERWQVLQARLEQLTPDERRLHARLERRLRHTPVDPADHMPTLLGNVLRAGERRPLVKYGLDAVICWPRLWLLLPEGPRSELTEARADLNTAVRVWLWVFASLVWSLWAWWLPLVILPSLVFIYAQWMLPVAARYGDLIEAAFDVYRRDLYAALGWPRPTTPAEEHALGRQLTAYLWRGSDARSPTFHWPG